MNFVFADVISLTRYKFISYYEKLLAELVFGHVFMGTPFRCYWESRSIGRKWFVGKFCVCVWKVFSEFSFSDRKCCFWNIVLNCTFDFKGRMLGHLRGLAGPQMVGGTWSIPGSCRPQQYRQRVFQAVTIPAKSIPGRNNPGKKYSRP